MNTTKRSRLAVIVAGALGVAAALTMGASAASPRTRPGSTPTITTAATPHSAANHPPRAYLTSQVSTANLCIGIGLTFLSVVWAERATAMRRVYGSRWSNVIGGFG